MGGRVRPVNDKSGTKEEWTGDCDAVARQPSGELQSKDSLLEEAPAGPVAGLAPPLSQ